MKPISILLSTLFLLAGINANAQMHGDIHHNTQQDSSHMSNYHWNMHRGHMMGQGIMPFMMGGDMNAMHGMRGNGMMNLHDSGMMHYGMITHFPMLDEELDLSSTQVNRLNNMKEVFLEKSDDIHNRINQERRRLMEMVNNEASGEQYRRQLMSYYESLIELQGAAYETYNEMKKVLSEKQRQKMENQVADLRHHHNEERQDDHYMDNHHREGGMHHNW